MKACDNLSTSKGIQEDSTVGGDKPQALTQARPFDCHQEWISEFTAQPVDLTNTQKMLHRNFNQIVGVFKAAINMQKEFKL